MEFENLNRFACINDHNKYILNKAHNQNVVYYSELQQWYTENSFRSFSLKCAIEGSLHYQTVEKDFFVKKGQVLIACRRPNVKGILDFSEKATKSICIDISDKTLFEVLNTHTIDNDDIFDKLANGDYVIPQGIEKITSLFASSKLNVITKFISKISKDPTQIEVHNDWFYKLTEQVVKTLFENKICRDKIIFTKKSTQTEIINRLNLAIEYMEDNFLSINKNGEIAKHCMISEYHFIRMFHQRFGLSPYQFILKKRLELVKYYLLNKDMSLTEIASHTGFSDKHSLSKAFKKEFKINTSDLKIMR